MSGAAAIFIAFSSVPALAALQKWTTYKSNILGLQVSVPSDWSPAKTKRALAFRFDDQAGGVGAVGFLKSSDVGTTIDEQAEKEFVREGKPANWTKTTANVSGMPAVKMVGLSPQDASRKVVHYFVQTPGGVYLVQCQASADHWSTFSPIFAMILTKLRFLSQAPE